MKKRYILLIIILLLIILPKIYTEQCPLIYKGIKMPIFDTCGYNSCFGFSTKSSDGVCPRTNTCYGLIMETTCNKFFPIISPLNLNYFGIIN